MTSRSESQTALLTLTTLSLFAILLLYSCGGGGGGGAPPAGDTAPGSASASRWGEFRWGAAAWTAKP